jgi:hypothetical protein
MATIVDALVVTLGLDARGVKKGEQDVAQSQKRLSDGANRTAKDFEQLGKQISQAINGARNAVIGLFTVFTAGRGISGFVRETTEGSAALGRMARDLRTSTEALSAWEGVSRRAGNAAGEVTGAFQQIQQIMQNFHLMGTAVPQVFRNLGIALADPATGVARSAEDIYEEFLRKLHGRPAQERLTLAQSAGFGQETVNLAALPEQQRRAMLAERRSTAITEEDRRAAVSRQNAWLNLDDALTNTARALLRDLTPGIVAVLDKLKEFATYLGGKDFKPVFEALAQGVERFARYLGSDEFAASMRSIRDGFIAFGKMMQGFLRWLGVLAPEAATAGGAPSTPGSGLLDFVTGLTEQQRDEIRERRERANRAPGTFPAGAGAAPGTVVPRGEAGDRERQAYQYFLAQGWTPAQAAGIVANLREESNFNPNATHDPDSSGRPIGFGLAGWNNNGERPGRPGRLTRLGQFIGRDPRTATFEEQLAFANHELTRGDERAAGDELRRQTTANEAGQVASRAWLRPGAVFPAMARRGAIAEGTLRRMSGQSPGYISGTNIAPDLGLITGARGAVVRDGARSSTTNTTSNEAAINGPINIYSQASDAGGIARDIASALRRSMFVDQATTGLA